MADKKRYIVLHDLSLQDLIDEVNHHMIDGYVPVGGVTDGTDFYQAMVLPPPLTSQARLEKPVVPPPSDPEAEAPAVQSTAKYLIDDKVVFGRCAPLRGQKQEQEVKRDAATAGFQVEFTGEMKEAAKARKALYAEPEPVVKSVTGYRAAPSWNVSHLIVIDYISMRNVATLAVSGSFRHADQFMRRFLDLCSFRATATSEIGAKVTVKKSRRTARLNDQAAIDVYEAATMAAQNMNLK